MSVFSDLICEQRTTWRAMSPIVLRSPPCRSLQSRHPRPGTECSKLHLRQLPQVDRPHIEPKCCKRSAAPTLLLPRGRPRATSINQTASLRCWTSTRSSPGHSMTSDGGAHRDYLRQPGRQKHGVEPAKSSRTTCANQHPTLISQTGVHALSPCPWDRAN